MLPSTFHAAIFFPVFQHFHWAGPERKNESCEPGDPRASEPRNKVAERLLWVESGRLSMILPPRGAAMGLGAGGILG